MITALTIALAIWAIWAFLLNTAPASETYTALNNLRERLSNGQGTRSAAGRHVLEDMACVCQQHPELFEFEEPTPLEIRETGEIVWCIEVTQYTRARYRGQKEKGHTTHALFHDTGTQTLKPYTW